MKRINDDGEPLPFQNDKRRPSRIAPGPEGAYNIIRRLRVGSQVYAVLNAPDNL